MDKSSYTNGSFSSKSYQNKLATKIVNTVNAIIHAWRRNIVIFMQIWIAFSLQFIEFTIIILLRENTLHLTIILCFFVYIRTELTPFVLEIYAVKML